MIMIERKQLSPTLTELSCSEGYLRCQGEDSYFRRVVVKTADIPSYEWVPSKPAYTRREYEREVERLIAERYTTGQEIQFAREQAEAGEKYDEYLAYVDFCKEMARENLENKNKQQSTTIDNENESID